MELNHNMIGSERSWFARGLWTVKREDVWSAESNCSSFEISCYRLMCWAFVTQAPPAPKKPEAGLGSQHLEVSKSRGRLVSTLNASKAYGLWICVFWLQKASKHTALVQVKASKTETADFSSLFDWEGVPRCALRWKTESPETGLQSKPRLKQVLRQAIYIVLWSCLANIYL